MVCDSWNNIQSKYFPVSNRIQQGGALSSILLPPYWYHDHGSVKTYFNLCTYDWM